MKEIKQFITEEDYYIVRLILDRNEIGSTWISTIEVSQYTDTPTGMDIKGFVTGEAIRELMKSGYGVYLSEDGLRIHK